MQESRESYHHGDLRHALLDVGMELARVGGPEAVTLRAATRAAGVTVNAAYRHFDGLDDYLAQLAMLAQARLAERIEAAAAGAGGVELLRAVGTSYIAFAVDEPGWFATAFHVPADMDAAAAAEASGSAGSSPFVMLNDALDAMVAAGQVTPERRAGADVFCWSAVHGFSQLVLSGPLRSLDRATVDALAREVVEGAVRGVLT